MRNLLINEIETVSGGNAFMGFLAGALTSFAFLYGPSRCGTIEEEFKVDSIVYDQLTGEELGVRTDKYIRDKYVCFK